MSKSDKKKLISLTIIFVIALVSFVSKEIVPKFKNKDTQTERANGQITVHFIDVGQGDSTLVKTDNGKFVLIDAGTNDCEHELLSYLDKLNVEYIDLLVITHPHEDHMGSAHAVIEDFYVKNILVNGKEDDCFNCKNLKEAIDESKKHIGTEVYVADAGDRYAVDGVEFLVLSDGKAYEDFNDSSLCFRMDFGKSSFIFTGDASASVERDILWSDYNVDADVLKCGHHGSSTSNCEEFVGAVSPDIAIISCGRDNSYGHPHYEVTECLEERNVRVFRTDEDGNIVLKCSDEAIERINN